VYNVNATQSENMCFILPAKWHRSVKKGEEI